MDADRTATLAVFADERAPGALSRAHPLAKLTSFSIGGPADLLFDPPSAEVLAAVMAEARRLDVPVTLLGGGTNVLVSDRGVRGLVVRLGKAFEFTRWEEVRPEGLPADRPAPETLLTVGGATGVIPVAREAVRRGLAGLEYAVGIPGSMAGAARMNAGAFGGEVAEVIEALEIVTGEGEIVVRNRAELDFSYRKLALGCADVITSLRFRLRCSSVGRLQEVVANVQAKRRRSQPSGFPNAGSIFKNPPNEYAARLIDRTGLRGTSVGKAQVSPDHANFIVNTGGATAEDVAGLMSLVREEVWRKCGVWLEPEVRLVGEWE